MPIFIASRIQVADMGGSNRSGSLSLTARLFHIPADMIRMFDRDLAVASIPKRDHRNRLVDLHALRHTFGTHRAWAGVSLRIAMAAMRHSSIELTMNVYTDPALLDVAGAVESLPNFEDQAQSTSAPATDDET
jgi:integrase